MIRDRKWVKNLPQLMPRLTRLVLRDADEKQGQPAEQDVRLDAVGLPVKHGAHVDRVFEIAVDAFDLEELLVA
jgi:hypothetical protein